MCKGTHELYTEHRLDIQEPIEPIYPSELSSWLPGTTIGNHAGWNRNHVFNKLIHATVSGRYDMS